MLKNGKLKKTIKKFVPPIIIDIYSHYYHNNFLTKNFWYGDFKNWNDALNKCSGYDLLLILEKVKSSSLKVKNKEAVFERDSVLFYKEEFTWPLVTWLLKIALEQNNMLNIVDYGGSLGSTYFQNLGILSSIKKLKWNIIEQQHIVKIGREFFEDEFLRFYYSFEEYLSTEHPNVLLLSGVLQYLRILFLYWKR